MGIDSDIQPKKKTETVYIISVPDGLPSHVVETMSKAQAKAQSLAEQREP
jgi:hypothetical protein